MQLLSWKSIPSICAVLQGADYKTGSAAHKMWFNKSCRLQELHYMAVIHIVQVGPALMSFTSTDESNRCD